MCLSPVSFYGHCYERQNTPGTIYPSLFRFPSVINLLANLDTLIQRGFWVVNKVTIDSLCKPYHDVINILFWTSSQDLETLDKKEENYKKIDYLDDEKSILGEIKTIFQNLLKTFFGWNIKKIAGTSFTTDNKHFFWRDFTVIYYFEWVLNEEWLFSRISFNRSQVIVDYLDDISKSVRIFVLEKVEKEAVGARF